MTEDTIAAMATPPGEGAISSIRMSGPAALAVSDRIFSGKRTPSKVRDRSVLLGDISAGDGSPIDQVLLTVMRGPGSLTGEDVVEITCHGGYLAPRLVFRRLVEEGVRPADPGEFTRRAFLNGKMDLTQAEAVCEIVQASNEEALRVALRQLKGDLSGHLGEIEARLLEWLILLEANIDFPDEDISNIDIERMREGLGETCGELEALLEGYRRGRFIRDGVDVAIVGKPNVGKSSIFNRLVQQDRVIVSDIPGTTRDVVDGMVRVNGMVLKVHDTAGVRDPVNELEKEAAKRTRAALERADLALVVMDSSAPLSDEDHEILAESMEKSCLVVFNKTDLPAKADAAGLEKPIRVSALKGWGFEELIEHMKQLAYACSATLNTEFIVSERHAAGLRAALEDLFRARDSARDRLPLEFITSDVRHALDCLGEITGRQVSTQVLDEIFSRFCIGK